MKILIINPNSDENTDAIMEERQRICRLTEWKWTLFM